MTEDERALLLLIAGFIDRAACCLGDQVLLGEARAISQHAFAVDRASGHASGRTQTPNPFYCSHRRCPEPSLCHVLGTCVVKRLLDRGCMVLPRNEEER